MQDGRPDVPGPVRLDPGVGGGGEPVQVLGEVLHHVVALGLAVHQHVQADVFLQRDHPVDLGAHNGLVRVCGDAPGLVAGAGRADLAGLRERADRRGWQYRQACCLRCTAGRVRGAGRAVAERVQPRPDLGVHRRGSRGGLRGNRVVLGQRAAEGHDLIDLLPRERQAAGELRCQRRLRAQVERHVQQRAGRAHDHLAGQAEQRRAQRQRGRQVRAPHVPAVDHPGDQGLARRARRSRRALPGSPARPRSPGRSPRPGWPPAPAARRRSPRSRCSPAATAARAVSPAGRRRGAAPPVPPRSGPRRAPARRAAPTRRRPRAARRAAVAYASSSGSSRISGQKPGSAGLDSSRNDTGPSRTGRVSMP